MNILILEDDPTGTRIPAFKRKFVGHIATFVETTKDAIRLLNEFPAGYWDILFLDHDLGGEEMVESGPGTGYEVACWLEENPSKKPNRIYLHSLNPVGRQNMKRALPDAIEAPFAWK